MVCEVSSGAAQTCTTRVIYLQRMLCLCAAVAAASGLHGLRAPHEMLSGVTRGGQRLQLRSVPAAVASCACQGAIWKRRCVAAQRLAAAPTRYPEVAMHR